MQGTQVQYLFKELRSCLPCERKKKERNFLELNKNENTTCQLKKIVLKIVKSVLAVQSDSRPWQTPKWRYLGAGGTCVDGAPCQGSNGRQHIVPGTVVNALNL